MKVFRLTATSACMTALFVHVYGTLAGLAVTLGLLAVIQGMVYRLHRAPA